MCSRPPSDEHSTTGGGGARRHVCSILSRLLFYWLSLGLGAIFALVVTLFRLLTFGANCWQRDSKQGDGGGILTKLLHLPLKIFVAIASRHSEKCSSAAKPSDEEGALVDEHQPLLISGELSTPGVTLDWTTPSPAAEASLPQPATSNSYTDYWKALTAESFHSLPGAYEAALSDPSAAAEQSVHANGKSRSAEQLNGAAARRSRGFAEIFMCNVLGAIGREAPAASDVQRDDDDDDVRSIIECASARGEFDVLMMMCFFNSDSY